MIISSFNLCAVDPGEVELPPGFVAAAKKVEEAKNRLKEEVDALKEKFDDLSGSVFSKRRFIKDQSKEQAIIRRVGKVKDSKKEIEEK